MDEDKTKNGYESEGSPLVGLIRDKFQQAETSKIYDERRWLKAYRNYRGLYGPEMAFRENEKSRVFVKITKTKVLASFGQIIEVLFSQGKFPLGVISNFCTRRYCRKSTFKTTATTATTTTTRTYEIHMVLMVMVE